MNTFCLMIAAAILACVSFPLGRSIGKAQRYRLEQENQQLRRMLNDLRRVDEISFQAFSAMVREAANPTPPAPNP